MVNHSAHTTLKTGHPAPHRHLAPSLLLLFAMIAGPIGWMFQLLVGFATTSYLCMPSVNLPVTVRLFPLLTAFNLFGMALAGAGLVIAWVIFRRTGHELESGAGGVLDVGEGRTRFLAMGGIVISLVSLLATLASAFSLFLVPLCKS